MSPLNFAFTKAILTPANFVAKPVALVLDDNNAFKMYRKLELVSQAKNLPKEAGSNLRNL